MYFFDNYGDFKVYKYNLFGIILFFYEFFLFIVSIVFIFYFCVGIF